MNYRIVAGFSIIVAIFVMAACSPKPSDRVLGPGTERPQDFRATPNHTPVNPPTETTGPASNQPDSTAIPIELQTQSTVSPAMDSQTTIPTAYAEPSATPEEAEASNPQTMQATQTPTCETFTAVLEIEPSQEQLSVGETLVLTGVLHNTGCSMLGLPKYSLLISGDGGNLSFEPAQPEPILHSLGIPPDGKDEVQFSLQPTSAGTATFSITASFEVHVGYPGPAYWYSAASLPITVDVQP